MFHSAANAVSGSHSNLSPDELYRTFLPPEGIPAAEFRKLSQWKRTNFLARRNFWMGAEDTLIGIPLTAMLVSQAKRGEMLPEAAASAVGTASFPFVQAAIAVGMSFIPGLNICGITGVVSTFGAMFVSGMIESSAGRAFKTLSKTGEHVRRLEMGGNPILTPQATQTRYMAMQELTGAFQSSRRFLGQEARFMHR